MFDSWLTNIQWKGDPSVSKCHGSLENRRREAGQRPGEATAGPVWVRGWKKLRRGFCRWGRWLFDAYWQHVQILTLRLDVATSHFFFIITCPQVPEMVIIKWHGQLKALSMAFNHMCKIRRSAHFSTTTSMIFFLSLPWKELEQCRLELEKSKEQRTAAAVARNTEAGAGWCLD